MKITTSIVTVLALAAFSGSAHADGSLFTPYQEKQVLNASLQGKVSRVAFPSAALHTVRRMYIYTPPGYATDTQRTYPVLVMLHGTPGDPVDWLFKGGAHTVLDTEIAAGRFPACIAVFPNGVGPYHRGGSEWADSIDGRCQMETAITSDLPRFLKAKYRVSTDPAQWTIGGLSAGGYGAANLAVRHPDVFRNALVLSGDFEVKDNWGDTEQVFGTDPAVRAANSPLQRLRALAPEVRKSLRFYVAIGADEDDELVSENEAFVGLCRALGVPVRFDRDPGRHRWGFWSEHFQTALPPLKRWLAGES